MRYSRPALLWTILYLWLIKILIPLPANTRCNVQIRPRSTNTGSNYGIYSLAFSILHWIPLAVLNVTLHYLHTGIDVADAVNRTTQDFDRVAITELVLLNENSLVANLM